MKTTEFCYWLQGYFELSGDNNQLTPEQVQTIRKHLNLVFKHDIDPKYGSKEEQNLLNSIHNPSLSPSIWPNGNSIGGNGNELVRC